MIYTTAPYSVELKGNELFLHTRNGVFIVEDNSMISLLVALKDFEFISDKELKNLCLKITMDEASYNEVISYLTEETLILIELLPGFKSKNNYIIDVNKKYKSLLNSLLSEKYMRIEIEDINDKTLDNAILLFLIFDWPSRKLLEDIIAKVKVNHTCIFVFQVGDISVVSHAWNKRACTPCPLCLYDYLMDKIYADNTNSISSLANVIEYLKNEFDTDTPNIPLENIDIAYVLRVAMQYIDTIAGNGRGALSACSTKKITTLHTLTLDRSSYEIPFSFRCDCLNDYRRQMGVAYA